MNKRYITIGSYIVKDHLVQSLLQKEKRKEKKKSECIKSKTDY